MSEPFVGVNVALPARLAYAQPRPVTEPSLRAGLPENVSIITSGPRPVIRPMSPLDVERIVAEYERLGLL